jgi:hypothetical protein
MTTNMQKKHTRERDMELLLRYYTLSELVS